MKNIKWLLFASLSIVACNDDDNVVSEEPVSAGSANFSKYVALGDSFAAGFSDNALFKTGQSNSYPSILAAQFSAAGGGQFSVPYMVDDIGGFSSGGVQIPSSSKRLYFGKPIGADFDEPLAVDGISGTDISAKLTGQYSNLGVPGAKCIHLVTPGYALGNPYFKRFSSADMTTVMADAINLQPTFFSLWIGGNDALGYALAGGDASINPLTPSAGGVGVGFDASYDQLVNGLATGDRKGVVANIPYITSLPQFTYLKPSFVDTFKYYTDGDEKKNTRVVSAGDVATINQINSIVGFLDQVLTAYGQPDRFSLLSSATGATNPVLIKDETLTDFGAQITGAATASGNPTLMALANYLGATFGKARQTKTGDLIPLASSSAVGTAASLPPGVPSNLGAYGITYPLEDRHVLIPSEVTEINAQIDAYNIKIKAVADAKGLAFVDAKQLLMNMSQTGVSDSGYTLSTEFVLGGMFSLDGIHPTPRGYAYISNRFIDAINAKYGSTLKKVNIGTFRVLYPKVL